MHTVLFQLNTRCTIHELAQTLGRPATLDDLTDETLDEWKAKLECEGKGQESSQ